MATRNRRGLSLLALAVAVVAVLGAYARTAQPTQGPADTPAPAAGLAVLDTLDVAPEAAAANYDRDAFGSGWATTPTGCDTRDEVLAAESTEPATRASDGCDVVAGHWASPYDGYDTTDPRELEVDHVVALAEAWESGASAWAADQRAAYANDTTRPDALIAVTAATNQAKSDRDPAEWMPPNQASWCRYATAWVTQKAAWNLTVDPAEHDALRNVLTACPQPTP